MNLIDYIRFIGEAFHRQEMAPGDGETLIMWCWYLDFFCLLLTFCYKLELNLLCYIMIVVILLLCPFFFCRVRYTKKRQQEMFLRFHYKHIGKRLFIIWAFILSVCCFEIFFMLYLGIWKTS